MGGGSKNKRQRKKERARRAAQLESEMQVGESGIKTEENTQREIDAEEIMEGPENSGIEHEEVKTPEVFLDRIEEPESSQKKEDELKVEEVVARSLTEQLDNQQSNRSTWSNNPTGKPLMRLGVIQSSTNPMLRKLKASPRYTMVEQWIMQGCAQAFSSMQLNPMPIQMKEQPQEIKENEERAAEATAEQNDVIDLPEVPEESTPNKDSQNTKVSADSQKQDQQHLNALQTPQSAASTNCKGGDFMYDSAKSFIEPLTLPQESVEEQVSKSARHIETNNKEIEDGIQSEVDKKQLDALPSKEHSKSTSNVTSQFQTVNKVAESNLNSELPALQKEEEQTPQDQKIESGHVNSNQPAMNREINDKEYEANRVSEVEEDKRLDKLRAKVISQNYNLRKYKDQPKLLQKSLNVTEQPKNKYLTIGLTSLEHVDGPHETVYALNSTIGKPNLQRQTVGLKSELNRQKSSIKDKSYSIFHHRKSINESINAKDKQESKAAETSTSKSRNKTILRKNSQLGYLLDSRDQRRNLSKMKQTITHEHQPQYLKAKKYSQMLVTKDSLYSSIPSRQTDGTLPRDNSNVIRGQRSPNTSQTRAKQGFMSSTKSSQMKKKSEKEQKFQQNPIISSLNAKFGALQQPAQQVNSMDTQIQQLSKFETIPVGSSFTFDDKIVEKYRSGIKKKNNQKGNFAKATKSFINRTIQPKDGSTSKAKVLTAYPEKMKVINSSINQIKKAKPLRASAAAENQTAKKPLNQKVQELQQRPSSTLPKPRFKTNNIHYARSTSHASTYSQNVVHVPVKTQIKKDKLDRTNNSKMPSKGIIKTGHRVIQRSKTIIGLQDSNKMQHIDLMKLTSFDTKQKLDDNDYDLNDRMQSEDLDHGSINLTKNSDSAREMPRIQFNMFNDHLYDEAHMQMNDDEIDLKDLYGNRIKAQFQDFYQQINTSNPYITNLSRRKQNE